MGFTGKDLGGFEMNNWLNINWAVPFTGLLVTLKALGYLDWSWWLVFAPIWVPLSIVISIFVVYIVFSGFTK